MFCTRNTAGFVSKDATIKVAEFPSYGAPGDKR
jgi:hypothetical protein